MDAPIKMDELRGTSILGTSTYFHLLISISRIVMEYILMMEYFLLPSIQSQTIATQKEFFGPWHNFRDDTTQ